MTFAQIQDQALRRFKSSLRDDLKEWIRTFYAAVWDLEDWTFKHTTDLVTVTSGLQTVAGLPDDLGIPHELLDQYGARLKWLEPRDFFRRYYDSTGANPGTPCNWTDLGDHPAHDLRVGPTADSDSAAFQLLYERACGFYPSTTVNETTTLPDATLTVADTAAFPSAGAALVAGRKVTYTGKTETTLTGCTGGTGSLAAGDLVAALTASAGQLHDDSDVPLLPPDTHMILVYGAQAMGRTLESDVTAGLSDDRVSQLLDTMRRRYLIKQRGETEQYGDAFVDDVLTWG
jgi:hypothetical protein